MEWINALASRLSARTGFRRGCLPVGASLRILYVVHEFYPEFCYGTEKFVLHMAQAAQQAGHQVQVITWRIKGRVRRWQRFQPVVAHSYRHEDVPVTAVRLARGRPDRWTLQRGPLGPFARRFLARLRPHLVHVGHAMRMADFVLAAQDMRIPIVITLTDYWLLCPKITLLNSHGERCAGPAGGVICARDCPDLPAGLVSARLAQAHALLRSAGCIVSPSRFLRQVFVQEWPDLDIRVIRHGTPHWTANTRCPQTDRPLVVAYAGSLNRHKGLYTLIEAFGGVSGADVRLHIWGDGRDAAALRQMAAHDARITFCGIYGPEQSRAVFARMDVLAAPSLWHENNPFVVNEALACGVPVIASAVGGMCEMVQDGINGMLVPPGDAAALRAVLQQWVDDPARLAALKAGVQPGAIPTPAQEAAAYAALYQEVITR